MTQCELLFTVTSGWSFRLSDHFRDQIRLMVFFCSFSCHRIKALIACLFLSMSIIIYCSDLHDSCSYHEVLSSICGPKAKILVAADIAIATYGICIAYLVIIGDQYDRSESQIESCFQAKS